MGAIREVMDLLKTINAKLDWLIEAAQADANVEGRARAYIEASEHIQSQVTGR